MDYPQEDWFDKVSGLTVRFTWINDPDVEKYKPCTQAYGICFSEDNKILVSTIKDFVTIPGGTPEKGETAIETLKRELMEEADVTVSKIVPLGVQKVIEMNNPSKPAYFQYRFVCLIDELLPQTIDPDPGKMEIHKRELVPMEKITEVIKWGKTGDTMFADAIEVYRGLVK